MKWTFISLWLQTECSFAIFVFFEPSHACSKDDINCNFVSYYTMNIYSTFPMQMPLNRRIINQGQIVSCYQLVLFQNIQYLHNNIPKVCHQGYVLIRAFKNCHTYVFTSHSIYIVIGFCFSLGYSSIQPKPFAQNYDDTFLFPPIFILCNRLKSCEAVILC